MDDDGIHEVPATEEEGTRSAELRVLYRAIRLHRPVQQDGRWGMATLEVCLAVVDSA